MSNRPNFGKGKRRPLHIGDQVEAAAQDAQKRSFSEAARIGARIREAQRDDPPRPYQLLLAAYDEAGAAARRRYESEVPEDQWVEGRARMRACEHLRTGPMPAHWTVALTPSVLLCDVCFADLDLPKQCWLCGRHDDMVTHIQIVDSGTPVRLHAMVCDDCYPEGRDAPVT